MADEQIRIDVTATDDASKVLDDVADEAAELERLTPELEVTADTDQADRAIRELGDDADALSRKDTEILLRAKIDDAKGALKRLRDDLDQTGDKARDTGRDLDRLGGEGGLKTRGNAIADLTGPLGEASGAASDFAGLFDGLGDIAEDVAGKVGLNASAMSSAIGGIGIAVAGAAALWTLFQQNQQKARERQKELLEGQREINDAIREGDTAAAASKFNDLYGPDVITGAKTLGTSIDEVTDYILGNNDALQANIDKLGEQGDVAKVIADGLTSARDQYAETNGTLAEQDRVLRAVTRAFEGNAGAAERAATKQDRLEAATRRTKDTMDRLRGALSFERVLQRFQTDMANAMTAADGEVQATEDEILSLKESILDVAEYAKLTPIQVASLLERVDAGDYAGVKADVERLSRNVPVAVSTVLRDPSSYDAAEYRRRLQNAIGVVPIATRAVIRGANGQLYE